VGKKRFKLSYPKYPARGVRRGKARRKVRRPLSCLSTGMAKTDESKGWEGHEKLWTGGGKTNRGPIYSNMKRKSDSTKKSRVTKKTKGKFIIG